MRDGGLADHAQVRLVRAIACVAAIGAVAGCAPGASDELRALVDEVTVRGDWHGCEWGSSSFDSEPKSCYGCWDYVPGSLESVALEIYYGLDKRGFAVKAGRDARSVRLTAARRAQTLCVDVLAPGFARGRNTAPSEVHIPPTEVFVDVWAAEPRAAGTATARACAELPAAPE